MCCPIIICITNHSSDYSGLEILPNLQTALPSIFLNGISYSFKTAGKPGCFGQSWCRCAVFWNQFPGISGICLSLENCNFDNATYRTVFLGTA